MKTNFLKFRLFFVFLIVILVGFYIYKAYIYEAKPIFPRTVDSPWPRLYDPSLLGDFSPNRDVVASVNQTLTPPLDKDIIYSYHINKMGFRGEDQTITAKTQKILLLGDGYIFGVGLSGNKDIASQLAILLHEDYPDSSTVVLNAGNPGYSIVDELDYLCDKGQDIKPNLVIVIVSFDDLWEITRPIILRQAYKKRKNSKLYNLYFNIRWDSFYSLHSCKSNYLKRHRISEEEALEQLVPEYIRLAISLREEALKWGGKVLFVLYDNAESKYLKKIMGEKGLSHIFIEYPVSIQGCYLPDGHWTAEMCKFIAYEIKSWIKGQTSEKFN